MDKECIIIGGGLAGLSALNRLLDRSIKPLLIEKLSYPSHRLCGEFLSHESLPLLKEWGVPFYEVKNTRFYKDKKYFEFSFPKPAGSCSRYILDNFLLQRALSKGGEVLQNTCLIKLEHREKGYLLHLSNGNIVQSKHLIIGTGKLFNDLKPIETKYVGYKAHFEGEAKNLLEMHLIPNGYLGISPIGDNKINVAYLMKKNSTPSHPILGKMIFPDWIKGEIPEFGIRKTPHLKNVFFIGDAAGSIPPITGAGLSIALTSGCLAADALHHLNENQFKKCWQKKYQRQFMMGKLLHYFLINHSSLSFSLASSFKFLPAFFWKHTRILLP